MKRLTTLFFCLCAGLTLLSACSGTMPKFGASQQGISGVPTVPGGLDVRYMVGPSFLSIMSSRDLRHLQAAFDQAHTLPAGTDANFRTSGLSGTVTPVRDGRTSLGLFCREYRFTLTDGTKRAESRQSVCRQNNGIWAVMN